MMKHPFINDLSDKTIEELQTAIESIPKLIESIPNIKLVIVGKNTTDSILKAQPNPKIVTEISQTKSPIRDLYRWFGDDLSREAYVAAAGKEADDLKYFEGLKEAFGDRVQEEIIDDQFTDSDGDRVSGTDFRATIAELRQRYLQVKNNPGDKKALNDYNTTYNYFKSLFPEAVIQKGYLDDIQRVLGRH